MRGLLLAGLMLMVAGTCAAESSAAQAAYGGWRRVSSDAQIASGVGDTVFLRLPAVVAIGVEFKTYDSAKSRLVCCLRVISKEVKQPDLESHYRINPVWIEDLTGDIDGETFRPHLFEAERLGDLAHYEFSEHTESVGGLVVNPAAHATGVETLVLDGQTYRVRRTEEEMGSSDGSLATYDLLPSTRASKPLRLILAFRIY